jgi:transglutaminase-like putative cysteine protease
MDEPRFTAGTPVSLGTAMERYFQVALYLMVLTGFGTLAGTGTLDAPTVALVGAALLVRGVLLIRRLEFEIPPRWTTYLTLGYAPFYLLDLTSLSREFLAATVHLVLFGMVVRMFSARKERDYTLLAALAFAMVLASAVLTVDSVFLFAFAAFLLMAVVTFVLMEMRRSAQAATITARESKDQRAYRKMAFSLAGLSPALVGLTLLGATGIFFLLPRLSTGYLSGFTAGTDYSTGFSERVELGRIGQIQQSNAVVMHVQIQGDKAGMYDLKWRGVALANFNGKAWSNRNERFPLFPQTNGRFVLGPPAPRDSLPQVIHYRVLLEPIGTNVFFLASQPLGLKGAYRELAKDPAGSVFDVDMQHPISLYEADSDIASPRAETLREAGNNYPARDAATYLQLPPLDTRIPDLAREITKSTDTNYDKAVAIERYLTTQYGYTLQLPRVTPRDPLANFLFERKQGHCEYFASSMAVMLRTLGIPSRVVNGFRTTEFNDLTSSYVIRASSAHSWVEAEFPGYGWVGFDPTPSAGPQAHGPWDRMLLYLDAAASFWREWVVNYDASHQRALGQDAARNTRTLVERMRLWAHDTYEHLLARARRFEHRVSQAPGRWGASGLALMLAMLLAVNLGAIAAWIREQRLAKHPEDAPSEAAALWYSRLTQRLARRGVRKSHAQTPREFAEKIEDEPLRERVERFTSAYEAARFGESAEDAAKLPELYEEVVGK